MADTVEDSRALDAHSKPERLREFAALFPLGPAWEEQARVWSSHFAGLERHGDDHALCARAPLVFRAFATAPPQLRQPVGDCVQEMALGMRDYVLRRTRAPQGRLQLEDAADLERYCHVVAGTVGAMLVRLFAATSDWLDGSRRSRMATLAERFGMAMQLTNIIKDVADDARRGACFVPRALAARYSLAPEGLLDPRHRVQARKVISDLVQQAARALDAALAFTLMIPRRAVRLRLFCLWPLFLAVGTLLRVVQDDGLFEPGGRAKIDRGEVRRSLSQTTLLVWSDSGLRRLYAQRRAALQAALAG
jgi:farnesyl-diphosphate farnesyltransferase